jgi:hypothetical protein
VNHAKKMNPPGLQTTMTEETQASPFMAYLLTTLAALMAPTLGDLHLARLAAQEAIDAHHAQGAHQQMTVTQILAFAVTALDALRLSMPPDLALPVKLKLRANANALNRSARDNTQILEQARRTEQAPNLAEQAATMAEATPESAPEKPHTDWAGAMKTVAARLQAATAYATPAQQTVNALWIESLTGTANEIAKNTQAGSRANLLRTTLMASGQTFPSHLGHKRPGK